MQKEEGWFCSRLKYIGKETTVYVPAGLEDSESCFAGNRELEEINFTSGNRKTSGFSGCEKLRRVVFSDTMEIPDSYFMFAGCCQLTDFEVDPANPYMTSMNDMLLSKDGAKLLFCPPGKEGTVIVPASVREIGDKAFADCKKIENVVLPAGLEKLGSGAFWGCQSLKILNLPERIDTIPEYCFFSCVQLSSVDLTKIRSIQRDAFSNCKEIRLTIPQNTWMSGTVFEGCDPDNISFEEGAGGEDVFGKTIDPNKPLKPYPKLPLDLVKKPEKKLWLAMGFCTAPEEYSGYIQKQYAQYAKAQKKRIIKKAQDCRFEKVLAYYGESAPKASAKEHLDSDTVSLSMTEEEAKKLFKFSKRSSGISINEFKGICAIWQSQGNYKSYFLDGVNNRLTIPDSVGGKPVSHVAVAMLPDNAVIYCSDLFFQKLTRSVRVSTACAYLEDASPFPAAEVEEIRKFLEKYPSDAADRLMEGGSMEAVARFLDAVKPTTRLLNAMLEKATGNATLTALLLSQKEAVKTKTKRKTEQEFSLEEKSLPVSELKKLWTYSIYTTQEAPDTKLVELTHYKGHEKEVVIPGSFGKYALGSIRGLLLEGHDDVSEITFPAGDYSIDSCSLRNCSALADPQGFIVVQAGDRTVLTDYIGQSDPYSITLPDGITEIRRDAFRRWRMEKPDMREVIIPKSYKTIDFSAFPGCKRLQRIVFSEGVMTIRGLSDCDLPSLSELYIPASVTEIEEIDRKGMQNNSLRIYGVDGSAAEAFARNNNIEFIAQDPKTPLHPLSDFVIKNDALTIYLGHDTTVVLPRGITAIQYGAFKDNDTMIEIDIPEGVETIDDFAFSDCRGLRAVQFPKTLKEIGNYSFSGCHKLEKLDLSDGLKTIGNNAFMWCNNLTEVIIPETVQSIGKDAFSDCRSLKHVHMPSGLQKIGAGAFTNGFGAEGTIEIHALANSYAQRYAEENQLTFTVKSE